MGTESRWRSTGYNFRANKMNKIAHRRFKNHSITFNCCAFMKTKRKEHFEFLSPDMSKNTKIHTCGLSGYFNTQPPSQLEPSFSACGLIMGRRVWSRRSQSRNFQRGLRLLLNHLQKDVSDVSAGAWGCRLLGYLIWVKPSSTTDAFNNPPYRLLAPCPFGTDGINICIIVIMCCQTLATEVDIKIN